MLLLVTKHVKVIRVAGAACIHFRGENAGNFSEHLREINRIFGATLRLLLQPGHLRQQQVALEFAQAQVRAARARVRELAVPSLSGTTLVMEAATDLGKFIVIREHCAAFPGVEILAGLETEA